MDRRGRKMGSSMLISWLRAPTDILAGRQGGREGRLALSALSERRDH